MEYDLFEQLLHHRVTDEKSRDEDFLTEVFAYVLRNSRAFFNDLIIKYFELTRFPFENTNIETQVSLARDARPDILLDSSRCDSQCVIESKIESAAVATQLRKYQHYIEKHGAYCLLLISSRQRPCSGIPHDLKYFKHFYWEDVYKVIGRLIKRKSKEFGSVELFLLKALKELMNALGLNDYVSESTWLKYDGESVRQDPKQMKQVLSVLAQQLPDARMNAIKKHLPDDYIVEPRLPEISQKGSKPRPILSHFFTIEPTDDIWFGGIRLSTFFLKPTQVKTDPCDKPVICLEYRFFQTRINQEAIGHYEYILNKLGVKFNRKFQKLWADKIVGIYKETAQQIYESFARLSKDKRFLKLSSFRKPSAVRYWNSTTLAIAYTKDVITKYHFKSNLQKYYWDLLTELVPLLKEYGIFDIREDFFSRILQAHLHD